MKPLSHDEQINLTLRVLAVLDDWRLNSGDKVFLLGLPDKTRTRSIQKYQQGEALPFNETVHEHVGHLIGIGHSLRLANPRNAASGGFWVHRPHVRFDSRTPISVML